jgi:hypothetical protein
MIRKKVHQSSLLPFKKKKKGFLLPLSPLHFSNTQQNKLKGLLSKASTLPITVLIGKKS